jgi:hypothetical protein
MESVLNGTPVAVLPKISASTQNAVEKQTETSSPPDLQSAANSSDWAGRSLLRRTLWAGGGVISAFDCRRLSPWRNVQLAEWFPSLDRGTLPGLTP